MYLFTYLHWCHWSTISCKRDSSPTSCQRWRRRRRGYAGLRRRGMWHRRSSCSRYWHLLWVDHYLRSSKDTWRGIMKPNPQPRAKNWKDIYIACSRFCIKDACTSSELSPECADASSWGLGQWQHEVFGCDDITSLVPPIGRNHHHPQLIGYSKEPMTKKPRQSVRLLSKALLHLHNRPHHSSGAIRPIPPPYTPAPLPRTPRWAPAKFPRNGFMRWGRWKWMVRLLSHIYVMNRRLVYTSICSIYKYTTIQQTFSNYPYPNRMYRPWPNRTPTM